MLYMSNISRSNNITVKIYPRKKKRKRLKNSFWKKTLATNKNRLAIHASQDRKI